MGSVREAMGREEQLDSIIPGEGQLGSIILGDMQRANIFFFLRPHLRHVEVLGWGRIRVAAEP